MVPGHNGEEEDLVRPGPRCVVEEGGDAPAEAHEDRDYDHCPLDECQRYGFQRRRGPAGEQGEQQHHGHDSQILEDQDREETDAKKRRFFRDFWQDENRKEESWLACLMCQR